MKKWLIPITRLVCLPFCCGIFHNDAVSQFTKLAEVFTERVISCGIAQTTDEQLTKLLRLSPSSILSLTNTTHLKSNKWPSNLAKAALNPWGKSELLSNTMFLGSPSVSTSIMTLIWSAVFEEQSYMLNKLTDLQTPGIINCNSPYLMHWMQPND